MAFGYLDIAPGQSAQFPHTQPGMKEQGNKGTISSIATVLDRAY
jgi:hypothetical protein